jgi:dTDP-4-dehydrorhamnose reductase
MYIVIGASGFLGRYCIKTILEKTTESIIATYFHPLTHSLQNNNRIQWQQIDLAHINDQYDICKFYPVDASTKIIFLAMQSKPDEIYKNISYAWDINVVSVARIVNAFHNAGCLYYISSDQIYGESINGRKFIETDKYNPLNSYAQHNMLAEQLVLSRGFNVVRLSLAFGPSLDIWRPSFFDQIKSTLENGNVLDVFRDSYRSTLHPNQISNFLINLIENQNAHKEKIVNISSDDILSKYDLALLLAHKYNLNDGLVKPISVHENNTIFKYAKRANTLLLDNTLLKKLLYLDKINFEI